MSEDDVNWTQAAEAFERINRKIQPRYYERYPEGNFLKDVHNNGLPRAMETMFSMLFVENWDQQDPDVIILKRAWKTLNERGYI